MSTAAPTVPGQVLRWRLLIALVAAGAAVGLLVAAVTPAMYTATARSLVATRSTSSVSDLQQGVPFAQQVGRSYAAIATTPSVLDGVIQDLHLATTPDALARRVRAGVAPDSVVLDIAVSDPSPARAARIANAVQGRLGAVADSPGSSTTDRSELTSIEPAVAPRAPSSPSPSVDLLVGALGGAAVALLVALLRAIRRSRPGGPTALSTP